MPVGPQRKTRSCSEFTPDARNLPEAVSGNRFHQPLDASPPLPWTQTQWLRATALVTACIPPTTPASVPSAAILPLTPGQPAPGVTLHLGARDTTSSGIFHSIS